VFSVGSAPRLYDEDLTQLEFELGRVLEISVEGNWEERARKKLDGEKKTSYVSWRDSETAVKFVAWLRLVKTRILVRV
jgi:hypothetical protein